ncbi:modular serine protease isoform X2 [Nilaparvata lugens]|uniref:modular serine protease isoform X2 n=1 Tax=Nilaparvata lugens TaxID=108931 RepID=UPI00193D8742|nr:modular serine protease isoform X2 [Nilaparvata lugens]
MVHRNQLFTVFKIFYIFVLISLTATYVRCRTRINSSNKSPQQQQQVLNSCVVPKFNGTEYYLAGCVGETCSLEAGHRIPGNGSVLRLKCAESFILRQKQVDITVCYDGHWFPKRHSCQRTCKAIDLNTLDVACTYKGQAVSCLDDVRVGTQAAIACKQGFITDRNYEMPNHCLKTGKWKYVMYKCAPICGEMEGDKIKQEGLRNGIDTIDARQAPWNAAVYLAENSTFRMICGGTLLSEEFIITAAKCVKNESGFVRDLSAFGVAVGKTYKNWDDSRDSSVAQKFQVTEILDEAFFRQFFKEDSEIIDFARHIVVLRVKGVINFGSLVSPVCLDVERLNERVPNLVGTAYINWETFLEPD